MRKVKCDKNRRCVMESPKQLGGGGGLMGVVAPDYMIPLKGVHILKRKKRQRGKGVQVSKVLQVGGRRSKKRKSTSTKRIKKRQRYGRRS